MTLRTEADIAEALEALRRADPRLEPVILMAGTLPLRRLAPGLPGLLRTIMGQQVSTASADAIFARLEAEIDLTDPEALLTAPDEAFRRAGLSRAKHRTALAIAQAMMEGRLDLAGIEEAESHEAVSALVAVHGIGRWTAECHLLFAAGHPDIFPAGDLALQVAVAHAFALPERVKEKPLAAMAELWSPARSVAARLFWAYYRSLTRRDGAPVGPSADAGNEVTTRLPPR
ncbi:DNA-3-methyladenine glycosylase [Aureimonas sp. AU12]|uniref:DNA-3-methyladenine glycosylase family protein n=1 Tax=Aureimonas sp. AU12 TaxID=1638161 RepID=UPI0007865ECC|nr:DNA-3-methyladenine glycosylase [Aureimonas sp. AU12]